MGKPSHQKVTSEEVRPGVDPPATQEAEVILVIGPCHLVSTAGRHHLLLAAQTLTIHLKKRPQKKAGNAIVLTRETIRGPRM